MQWRRPQALDRPLPEEVLVLQSVRSRTFALPVCFVHAGGDSLRRSHVPRSNGRESNRHHSVLMGSGRTTMFTGQGLVRMRAARALLLFVRMSCTRSSGYTWYDNAREQRTVTQAEGGEKGDPLMPLLFSIGIQSILKEVVTHSLEGDQLCAGRRPVVRFSGRRVHALRASTCRTPVQGTRRNHVEDRENPDASGQDQSLESGWRGRGGRAGSVATRRHCCVGDPHSEASSA